MTTETNTALAAIYWEISHTQSSEETTYNLYTETSEQLIRNWFLLYFSLDRQVLHMPLTGKEKQKSGDNPKTQGM